MPARKFTAAVAIVILILGIVAGFVAVRGPRLFSDPTNKRSDTFFESVLVSPPMQRAATPTNDVFSQLEIERSTTGVKVRIPFTGVGNENPISAILRTNHPNSLKVGEGSVALRWIATGFQPTPTNFPDSVEVPAAFYSSDLQPMPTESLDQFVSPSERTVRFRGRYPVARFAFECVNLGEVKPLSFNAFDGRTRSSLIYSYSIGGGGEGFRCEADMTLWHQTPVDLVPTIATGPVETFTIEPKENAEISYSGGRLKLVAILDGQVSYLGNSIDGKAETVTIAFSPGNRASAEPATAFAFLAWPTASNLPLDIEYLDASGKMFSGGGGSTSSKFMYQNVRASLDSIKQIRVRFYPNVYRLVFTIPELPGLPEENRNVKNLFDVRVPYMQYREDWEVQDGVRRLLQMDSGNLQWNYTNQFIPFSLTNATPRELLDQFKARLADPKAELEADPVANKIQARRSLPQLLMDHLRRLLHR